ncbi:MAG: CHASE2 domain-containing protein, partial [Bdellovibrionales bacterium]|nr:CHASE2 domain-containing protein [Bdellovibrionales bacterium]
FTNKIVLIGPTTGTVNRFETPFGSLSRLEIHANIMDTFLNQREIRHLPSWVTVSIGAAAVLASATIILSFPLSSAWICLLILALFLLVVSLFLFAYFKVWIGLANPLVCIFGTHLLMMGYKLGRQEEKQQRIQQEAAHLKEMDQFKNNFISLFSHDLKTPIAKIKAIIGRLLSEESSLSAETRSSLKTVARTNDELARFISDILKVTRMETMSIEPAKEVIDLNRLVEEAVKRNRFQADEKDISVTVDLEPLFSMEGDQKLIEEIITNLLENAIKYSAPGSAVVISTREEASRVWVEVEDQGPGIPEEEIPRVMGKFYRGKTAEKTTKGSGLGLYLAKYFVELHEGTIEITSELGKGTRVRFSLPLPE